jgi:hypothetical protein
MNLVRFRFAAKVKRVQFRLVDFNGAMFNDDA